MKAYDFKKMWIDYFVSKGHKEIENAPLIPENDPSVLFTTAGMHPLVPYLLGNPHPAGRKLTNSQTCLRTNDIDSVGDSSHLTCFEMLGRWSLGEYFKEEAINTSYDFLVNYLKLDPKRISVTCFAGDEDSPKDEESASAWKKLGLTDDQIYFYGKEDNWWGLETGPCGPDSEIFYDMKPNEAKCGVDCGPSCHCGKYMEIGNNVFMQYFKHENGTYTPLKQKNVDTGFGLERIYCLIEGYNNVYDTELFLPILKLIKELSVNYDASSARMIADHTRSACLLIKDGVVPSNVGQGYVLRRMIRKCVRHLRKLGIPKEKYEDIIKSTIDNGTATKLYPALKEKEEIILTEILKETKKFMNTLGDGEKKFNQMARNLKNNNLTILSGEDSFKLYDTYGFPIEMTQELAKENGLEVDIEAFYKKFEAHQAISKKGNDQAFKGGLAETNEITTAYHTATHLLHKALKIVLGEHVHQAGSNITVERMRFDFPNPVKVSPEQLKEVEKIVNDKIKEAIPVEKYEVTNQEADKMGAIGLFDSKYGNVVNVYKIGDFSIEKCGGPHVSNTKELGEFKILKEEGIGAGMRRIKAILVKK